MCLLLQEVRGRARLPKLLLRFAVLLGQLVDLGVAGYDPASVKVP